MSGSFNRLGAWRADSQLPARTPTIFALFTRAIPAASSGASSPLSAASAASLRIAGVRTMIDDEPSLRLLQGHPHALTVALVKHQKLVQRHVVHRFVIGELTLSSTTCFTVENLAARPC